MFIYWMLCLFKFLSLEPDNPNRVLVKRLALVVEGRSDVILDLTGIYIYMHLKIIANIYKCVCLQPQ